MNVNEQAYGSKDLWYSIPYSSSTQFPASTTIEERNTLANFTDTIPSSIDWHLQLGRVIYEVEVNGNQTLKDLFYNTVFDRSICFVGQSGKSSYTSIRFFDNQGTDSNNPDARELPTQTYDVVNLAFNYGLGAMRDYGNGVRSWEVIGADINKDPSGNALKFDAIRWNPLGWPGIKGTNYYYTDYGNRYATTFVTNMSVKRNVLVPYVKAGTTDTSDTNAIGTYDLATYLSTYKDTKPYVYSIGFSTKVMYGDSIEASSSNQRTADDDYGLMLMEYISSLNDFYYIGPNNEWQTAHYNNDLFVPQILKSPYMPLGGYINNGSYASDDTPSTLGYESTLNSVEVHAVIDCNVIKWDTWVNVGSSTAEGTCNKVLIADARKYTEDEFREAVRHSLACFGMFFADSETVAKQGKLDDPEMHLGTIVGGIGYGDYTSGKDNRKQPQWNWKSMSENDYDPTSPPEPGDDPAASSDPMLPTGLSWTLATAGGAIWALDNVDIKQVWKDIFGKDIKLKDFGDNPMNAILSLEWTPFIWSSGTSGPVVLGSQVVNPNHVYPLIESFETAEKHASGQMKFDFNKNFYNARNMQARLFLPFYGYYELPTAQLLSSQLRLDFYYNVPDELGVYIISYDKVIYDFVECSCKIDIPVTGSNAAAIKENKKQQALTIATQVASMATTAIAAGLGLKFSGAVSTLKDVYSGAGNIVDTVSSIPWLEEAEFKKVSAGGAAIGAGTNRLIKQGIGLYNTVNNAQIQRATLKTNLPYHGSALQTTFLHMSMKPYVQIFKNAIMGDLNTDPNGTVKEEGGTVKEELGGTSKEQYMLKVGHACDIFTTMDKMPENSLLQTTGCANMGTDGMLIDEVKELNDILQSGFYR